MKSLSKKYLFLILVVILLIFFRSPMKILQNFSRASISGLQRGISNFGFGIKNFSKNFSSKKQLIDENNSLKNKVNELLIANKDLNIALKETKILEKQATFLESKKLNYVLCHVIGKSSENPLITGNLILDKGENDGIKVGYPVIIDEGFLVGKITKTTKNISYLSLILDNQSTVAAKTEDDVHGLVSGEHQLSLAMDFILPDKKVSNDEMVITSGLEPLIPQGLIIGKVRKVEYEQDEFFQKATLNPLINFDNLQIVSVLIPPGNENK